MRACLHVSCKCLCELNLIGQQLLQLLLLGCQIEHSHLRWHVAQPKQSEDISFTMAGYASALDDVLCNASDASALGDGPQSLQKGAQMRVMQQTCHSSPDS